MVAAPPAALAPADLARIAGPADWIELRLDLLLPLGTGTVEQWIAASPRPVLLTLRSKAEGGAFEGSWEEAAQLLGHAMHVPGVVAVDFEPDVEALVEPCPRGVVRLVSTHTWERAELPAPAGSIRKRAVSVDDSDTLARAKSLQSLVDGFVVPFGRMAAVRAAFLPTDRLVLLYGAASTEAGVVAHQPTLAHLLDELRAGEVGLGAELYGLVGCPPAWSPSPAMHNAVFRATDRDALYVPLPALDLDEAMALPVAGLSVTMPYKRAAFSRAHEPLDVIRRIESVNTLLPFASQRWWGGNTDLDALTIAVPAAASNGAFAYVYGAGGFAASAVVALQTNGYVVRIGARDAERAARFADRMHVSYMPGAYERHEADAVVVNATPAGASGEAVEAFASVSLEGLTVVDGAYGPKCSAPTGLVAQAQDQGAAQVVDGRGLLVGQGCLQAVVFGAPDEGRQRYAPIMQLAVDLPASLWLLGIRGAGKTSIGRAVARQLGRPFVDLDEEVERTTGRTPAQWIERDGIEAFRYIESRVVEVVSARRGIVVATGGGVVELPSNRTRIAAGGVRVWLGVSPERAVARMGEDETARPLLFGAADARTEAEEALRRRATQYRQLADAVVDANGTADEVARDVTTAWLHAVAT